MVRVSEGTLWFFGVAFAVVVVWLLYLRSAIKEARAREAAKSKKLDDTLALVRQHNEELKRGAETARLDAYKIAGLETLIAEKSTGFPWLSRVKCEFDDLIAQKLSYHLEHKSHPARKAASDVDDYRKKAREFDLLLRRIRHRQEYCEYLFPWLQDLFDEDIAALLDAGEHISKEPVNDENSAADPAQSFMAKAEYEKLSELARNQLALDRYLVSRKTKWQIGREFERFVGYGLERDGYSVNYFGATEGLEDLGRDLIAVRRGETLIVQCKYWSSHRTIHEKHIYQLFGTKMDYVIENNINATSSQGQLFLNEMTQNIKALILTTAPLSERAKKAARLLRVDFEVLPPHNLDYPRVKCNISKRDGARIYHLPFDQQYDRVKIDASAGEFYASACEDAEAKGNSEELGAGGVELALVANIYQGTLDFRRSCVV